MRVNTSIFSHRDSWCSTFTDWCSTKMSFSPYVLKHRDDYVHLLLFHQVSDSEAEIWLYVTRFDLFPKRKQTDLGYCIRLRSSENIHCATVRLWLNPVMYALFPLWWSWQNASRQKRNQNQSTFKIYSNLKNAPLLGSLPGPEPTHSAAEHSNSHTSAPLLLKITHLQTHVHWQHTHRRPQAHLHTPTFWCGETKRQLLIKKIWKDNVGLNVRLLDSQKAAN